MNRRGSLPFVVEPMRATEGIICRCRAEVDSRLKTSIRIILNRFLRRWNSISEMGEGFQLGLLTRVPAGSRLGRYGYIGNDFESPSPISVGDLCMLSTNIAIVDNDHGLDDVNCPMRLAFRWAHRVTVFEADVWVGRGPLFGRELE